MGKKSYGNQKDEITNESCNTSQRLLPEEREVVLIMNDRERRWEASCSSPTYMRKFEKQGWKCVGTQYYRNGEVHTKFYVAPCSSVSIGRYERPKRTGRIMTEEQLRKMQEGRRKKISPD